MCLRRWRLTKTSARGTRDKLKRSIFLKSRVHVAALGIPHNSADACNNKQCDLFAHSESRTIEFTVIAIYGQERTVRRTVALLYTESALIHT
jgi:hypothetical protein